jgi:hypothetical protein
MRAFGYRRNMAFDLPREGTRRLRIVLGAAACLGFLAALAVILLVYGPPFWRGWWVVIGAMVVLSGPAGYLSAQVVEWVIAGYREPTRSEIVSR